MLLAPQVDKLLFRHIALFVEDPSSLVCTSKLARDALNSTDYEFEWFSSWHGRHCPSRPWQYAVICWGRRRGADAASIAQWLLLFFEWKTRLEQQLASLKLSAGRRTASSRQFKQLLADLPKERQPEPRSFEGRFTTHPEYWPLLSTVREAKALLSKGRAVHAVLKLCPDSGSLLLAYCSKAQNVKFLQQLLDLRDHGKSKVTIFPAFWYSKRSACTRYISNLQLCCFSALQAGDAEQLQLLLKHQFRFDHEYLLQLLLRHAVRHSNTDCIKLLLSWGGPFRAQVQPQHLTIAATRTDPWAPAMIQQLLGILQSQKQLKVSSMRPACAVACSTGNWQVLGQLLPYAAAAPQQRLPILLEAAVAAGNPQTLEQLLQLREGRGSSSDCRDNGQHQQQQEQQQQLPVLDWSCLTEQQVLAAVERALPGSAAPAWYSSSCSRATVDQQHADLERAAAAAMPELKQHCQQQVAMADLIWQHLVVDADRESQLLQLLRKQGLNSLDRLLRQCRSCCAFVLRLRWMHQHGFLQQMEVLGEPADGGTFKCRPIPVILSAYVLSDLQPGGLLQQAADAGHFLEALQLYHLLVVEGFNNKYLYTKEDYPKLLRSVIGGHLRKAAAAGDAAAVAQLDRLASFCSFLFGGCRPAITEGPENISSITDQLPGLHTPQVMTHISTGILGRVTTAARLATELGLSLRFLNNLMFYGAVSALHFVPAEAAKQRLQLLPGETAQQEQQQQQHSHPQQQQIQTGALEALLSEKQRLQQLQLQVHPLGGPDNPDYATDFAVSEYGSGADALAAEYADRRAQLQQLDARLAAAEILRAPHATNKQQQPLPLWQQCFLQLAALSRAPVLLDVEYSPGHYLATALHADAANPACCGEEGSNRIAASSGRQRLQRLLSDALLITRPPASAGSNIRPPLSVGLMAAIIEKCDCQMLAWTLYEDNRGMFWGEAPGSAARVLKTLLASHCTPISNYATRRLRQQQLDLQQMQQYRHHGIPPFAHQAAQLSLPLLNLAATAPDLLSSWLKSTVRPAAAQPDLERAKAIVAAVAAAEMIPAGARILKREALRQVLVTGDLDLLALVSNWAGRLEVWPEVEGGQPWDFVLEPVAADAMDAGGDDVLPGDWVPGAFGADGQLLPVLVPGEDDEDNEDAMVM